VKAGWGGGDAPEKTKGFQTCVPSRSELEMSGLQALLLQPMSSLTGIRSPLRGGRPPRIREAELVARGVCRKECCGDRMVLAPPVQTLPFDVIGHRARCREQPSTLMLAKAVVAANCVKRTI
jgi:hypothetical protein